MAEVYVDSNDSVYTKIFWNNDIVDADANVLADIYDITEDPSISPAVNPQTPLYSNVVATKSETDIGTYSVSIPRAITDRNRNLKIIWRYNVGGSNTAHKTLCDVVTPYVSFAEAIEDLNLGTDPSDPNYKTYHQLRMSEKYARKIIENYTGQQFYLYNDTAVVYGAGTNILPLSFKLNAIHKLYADDYLLVDNISDPEVNNWNYEPIISETGFGIRINEAELLDNTVYVANGLVPPTINDYGYQGAFRKNVRYKIEGKFGWSKIPDNIEEAAIILIGEYFSKDVTWRNKYIQNLQSFDWQFEYTDDVFKGTGNLYVDQLLQPYVITSMLVV